MAEFIIIAKRHWSYKPDMTSQEGQDYNKQYQVGDIVQVFPDGALSDYANDHGKFFVVRILGLAFEDALKYQESDVDVVGDLIKRRKYNLQINPNMNMTNLPIDFKRKTKLPCYVYDVTWDIFKKYVFNKLTGIHE